MKNNDLFKFAEEKYQKCLEIMTAKNHDYSYGDDALSNFKVVKQYDIPVEHGFITRLSDKFKRISNILKRKATVVDETTEDTILDMINYLMLLLAYLNDEEK